jgi:hypothetical protein
MPGISVSARSTSARSAPGSRRIRPSSQSSGQLMHGALTPCRHGTRSDPQRPAHPTSGSMGDPPTGCQEACRTPAPAGLPPGGRQRETCCPSTARTANSSPSTAPGTRMPGTAATSGDRAASAARTSSTATLSASRSNNLRQRATAAVRSRKSESRKVACRWPFQGSARRHRCHAAGQDCADTFRLDLLDAGHRSRR